MTVCSCERAPLSQAQTVVRVCTVTGVEHLSDVMEGNRYPDSFVKTASKPSTACDWIPLAFRDFSEVFFSCYCGHTLINSLCL